nr:asnovolin J 5',6'-dehydrogenase [Verruciconidia persicina]
MKVAILGATGETGRSIVNGLLQSTSPQYKITALTRPASLNNRDVLELASRGVDVVRMDLDAPQSELQATLKGQQIVICSISAANIDSEISLINAAKAAGVERYVPSCFAIVMPPTGRLQVREQKEVVMNHIKKLHLPYTVIDVGYWYQLGVPHLPSGRTSYIAPVAFDRVIEDGNTPSGFSDLRDVGKWVARIISDPRTLNKMVFGFNTVVSQNQIYETLERLSGETVPRNMIKADEILVEVKKAEENPPSPDSFDYFHIVKHQYWYSLFILGENTPQYAEYLGYLDARRLYPDLKTTSLQEFIQDALDGKVDGIYQRMVAAASAHTE